MVASAVGGVPEIIEDEITGRLVPFEPASPSDSEPADPERFAHDLARAINELVAEPHLARKMGEVGRRRVMHRFSWPEAARRIVELYRGLSGEPRLASGLAPGTAGDSKAAVRLSHSQPARGSHKVGEWSPDPNR